MRCVDQNFDLVLGGAKAQDGSDVVNVGMVFKDHFSAGFPRSAIEKILAIYDVTGLNANGCLAGSTPGVYSKPSDSFVLSCQANDRSLQIIIRQKPKN